MENKTRKYIFICSGIFHLFTSVYLASEIPDGHGRAERILLFIDIANKKPPLERFEKYFDRIYIQPPYGDEWIPWRLIKRMYLAGWLFPLSGFGRECYKTGKKCCLFVFDDYELMTNRAIQALEAKKETITLVDEGMMTYSVNQYWNSIKRRKWLDFLLGIKIQALVEHNHAIDTILCRYPDKIPEVKRRNRTVKKLPNIFSDQLWCLEMADLLELNLPDLSGKNIFWLGQPLIADGIAEDCEMECIERIAALFCEEYNFIVKAHPRDRNGKYEGLKTKHIKVLDIPSWIPFELIVSRYRPKLALSVYSTATDAVLDIDPNAIVIYCAKIIGLKLDRGIENMLQGDRKYYPDTLEELKEIIRNL